MFEEFGSGEGDMGAGNGSGTGVDGVMGAAPLSVPPLSVPPWILLWGSYVKDPIVHGQAAF